MASTRQLPTGVTAFGNFSKDREDFFRDAGPSIARRGHIFFKVADDAVPVARHGDGRSEGITLCYAVDVSADLRLASHAFCVSRSSSNMVEGFSFFVPGEQSKIGCILGRYYGERATMSEDLNFLPVQEIEPPRFIHTYINYEP